MNIEIVSTGSGLESLEPEWIALWNQSPRATPFQSPEWLLPWTCHLFGGGEIWAITARDPSGRLTGFAPLFRWGIEHCTVSFLGAGISDYADILGDLPLLEYLGEKPGWDTLDFQEIRPDSPLLRHAEASPCSVCPVLSLSDYPASLDPKHRTDLRRARNKLARSCSVRFATADQETLPEFLEAFFRLHDARYHSLTPPLKAFHTEAAAGFLAAGRLRLHVIFVDKSIAAAIYAFTAHSRLYFYLSGFDESLARLSPGAVLIQHALEQAQSEGLAEADFLRDPEPYKYLWGARDRISYRLQLSASEMRAATATGQPASSRPT